MNPITRFWLAASALLVFGLCVGLNAYAVSIDDRREQCIELCYALGDRFVFVNDYGCACSERDPLFSDPENRWIRIHPRGR